MGEKKKKEKRKIISTLVQSFVSAELRR